MANQVSCRNSNKWAIQDHLLRETSQPQMSYNNDGFNSTKFGLLVKDVKYALRTEINNTNNLVLVDALQRMGIENHFQEEIQSILQKEYEQSACFLKYQTPFDVSLCFRLLRQQAEGKQRSLNSREHVIKLIEDEWKKLKNPSSRSFSKVPLMYSYDHKQSLPVLQEYIKSMLYGDLSV
ncbi:hypothetical protein H5410_049408 [Solanum commersonii]|uniref:Terpene synthase N-terminal domain-containing protein n=1 Tax=Solanum commersonii TaxID=4109 RepID=A0A9J5WU31_SOLCO|nr:hypothetical protein H5410_049408 [Solanum commersonii]